MSRLSEKADAVIIGGGAAGLGLAYRLVERGMKNVVVLEKGYIGSGATGRFPGGVTQLRPTMDEITLARNGVKILERLSGELNYNIMFRRGGSLVLAFTEEQIEQLGVSVRLQNVLRIKSKLVEPSEVKKIVPMMNIDKILGAAFCPTDGIVYPNALLFGYVRAVKRGGGDVRTFVEAKGIKVEGGEVKAVLTERGEIETPFVVNAAGSYSADIARMAGANIPNQPNKREFFVIESLKPFLKPFILSLRDELCLAQMLRGEAICSLPGGKDATQNDTSSSVELLERMASSVMEIMPQFRDLKVQRQWAALYDVTTDGKPVLGELEGVRGFIQANGFCGSGIEMSAAAAELLAGLIVDGRASPLLEAFSAERFVEKKPAGDTGPAGDR